MDSDVTKPGVKSTAGGGARGSLSLDQTQHTTMLHPTAGHALIDASAACESGQLGHDAEVLVCIRDKRILSSIQGSLLAALT